MELYANLMLGSSFHEEKHEITHCKKQKETHESHVQ
jgi:hypothetical protein